MQNLPRTHCFCDEKLGAAEAELRDKAKRHPECSTGYQQAALEVQRVRHRHFGSCCACQTIEAAEIVAAGKAAHL